MSPDTLSLSLLLFANPLDALRLLLLLCLSGGDFCLPHLRARSFVRDSDCSRRRRFLLLLLALLLLLFASRGRCILSTLLILSLSLFLRRRRRRRGGGRSGP